MGLNPLLKNVPDDILILIHPGIRRRARMQNRIVKLLYGFWAAWLVLLPISKFPITVGIFCNEYYVMPDFGTGKFYSKFRIKYLFIDYI